MQKTIIRAMLAFAFIIAFIIGFTMKTPYDGEVKITRISKIVDGPFQVRYELNGNDYVQNFPTEEDRDNWIGK